MAHPGRTQSLTGNSRWPAVGVLFGSVSSLVYALFASRSAGAAFSWFWDVGVFHIPVLVALVGLVAVLSRARGDRRGWALLVGAFALWSSGSLYWKIVQQPNRAVAAFTGIDGGRLILYPMAALGLLLIGNSQLKFVEFNSRSSPQRAGQLNLGSGVSHRPTLEVVAAVCATFALCLTVLLRSQSFDQVADQSWTNVAYPIGDSLLLTVVVGLMVRRSWHTNLAWWGLLVSLTVRFVANLLYLNTSAGGFRETRSAADVVFPLAVMGVAMSVYLPTIRWMPKDWVIARLSVQALITLLPVSAVVLLRPSILPLLLALVAVATISFAAIQAARREGNLEVRLLEASTDPITGLPVRSEILEQIRSRRQESLTLVVVDLVGFRLVNESLGRDAGDEILRSIGASLQMALPASTVGRLGGDEFIALWSGSLDVDPLCRQIQQIVAATTYREGRMNLQLSAWCGAVTVTPGWNGDPVELLRSADAALLTARTTSGNGYRSFDEDLGNLDRDRRVFVASLREKETPSGLQVFLQPKVELQSGTVIGAEALARWHHLDRGILSPDSFLSSMTSTDRCELTGHIVSLVTREAVRWKQGGRELHVALNVTASDLVTRTFAGDFLASVERSGLNPAQFTLELTEEELLHDWARGAQSIAVLRKEGVRVAIDDFGTGYSSLAVLHRLPFDEIKLDREFLGANRPEAEGSSPVLAAAIAVAASMGVAVIAEGVETAVQRDQLIGLGCRLGQGYFYARPMPFSEFDSFSSGKLAVGAALSGSIGFGSIGVGSIDSGSSSD
jgi:diguanylate cyclase